MVRKCKAAREADLHCCMPNSKPSHDTAVKPTATGFANYFSKESDKHFPEVI